MALLGTNQRDQEETAQQGVHPTGGSRRVFRQVVWLEVGSGKVALPRPAHQRVTPTVRRLFNKECFNYKSLWTKRRERIHQGKIHKAY